MRYKLIEGSLNDTSRPIETVLLNRGIKDYKQYLSLNKSSRDTYYNLDNIQAAIEMFDKHFQHKDPIGILMDNDVDGTCSATLMYKFIKGLDENYDVRIYVHQKNKSHGLADRDFDFDDDIKLLIVPDAGSNDVEEHCILSENGVSCICADHHQVTANIENSPAIILNNQSSAEYANKNCCGASITLEFCRALEEYYWEDICDNYLDLVAVANVCDVMSISEHETKAIINEGLSNINNKMLQAIIEAQEFSMKGIVNPHTVGFYIGPLINAFIRLATFEERMLLIRAFCEDESETFEYTKRGEVFPIEENIYEHVVRLMKSYKGKQDRTRDKAVKLLLNKAEKCTDDKVAIIDATQEIDGPLTGLVAIRISEAIHKPVLLVREHEGNLSGSGRAFNNCPIEDFRGLVEQCPHTIFAQGHPSAYGVSIYADKIDEITKWLNEKLEDVNMEKIYHVDFMIDIDDINIGFIKEIDNYKNLWGHGVAEPIIAIENITIPRSDIQVQGKNFDSIAFNIDGIKFVQFKMSEDDALLNWISEWDGDPNEEIVINIVGEVSISEYKGIYTPQVIIKESQVTYVLD